MKTHLIHLHKEIVKKYSKKQCCGSYLFISFILDPGSWLLLFVVLPFFVAKILQNWKLYCVWTGTEKKNCANWHRLQYFLPKKLPPSSQKYGLGIRDAGSGIRKNLSRIQGSKKHWITGWGSGIWDLEKTYLGSRGQKGNGSRVRISNTG